MYHDLKVDGTSLKGYKVYINGTEAYNSAERDVEFIEIPGRSGAFALDKKRFKNITVQYNSGTFAENQPEFARKISDLRNFLASRDGYVRIEDDYNPEEYRMGVFSRGLEFDPVCYNMASEFPIEFNCKPQRFLKIGDLPVSVASGDVITNPTLFNAHPLISFQASGSGTINLGTQAIEFFNAPLGTINLPFTVSTTEASTDTSDYVEFSGSYNTGDKFRVKGSKATFNLTTPSKINAVEYPSGMDLRVKPYESSSSGTSAITTLEDWQETEFTIGTASTVNKTYTPTYVFGGSGHTITFTLQLIYDGDTTIRMKWTATLSGGMTLNRITTDSTYTLVCESTANSLTGDLYIDLDIGEAYKVDDGNVTSINNFVNLGGELPVLPPGSTTISFDNTISNVEITPRYWRV